MGNERIKVCFFLGGFYQNGGIGRVTSMLANEMTAKGNYEIIVLCYCNSRQPNLYPLAEEIHQLYFLKKQCSMTKAILTGGVNRLRKFLNENEVDVAIACGALYYPIVTLSCKTIKTRAICWEHSDPRGNKDHRVQYLARRFGIKKSDLNVVLTKKALDVYKKEFGARRTIQIYNPIDTAVLKQSGEYNTSSTRIISVGRLTYQKNFQDAVRIAKKVLPRFSEWHWDIYGKGEDFEELQILARTAGIENQMHFCGQVSDLYDRYREYSFMVMTSRYEGFPMTLLEGLGIGLPLISYDIQTGPSEIIENGKNGFLIPKGDIEEAASSIVKLIQNEQLRKDMSKCSLEKCEQFSLTDIYKKWDRALHSVL